MLTTLGFCLTDRSGLGAVEKFHNRSDGDRRGNQEVLEYHQEPHLQSFRIHNSLSAWFRAGPRTYATPPPHKAFLGWLISLSLHFSARSKSNRQEAEDNQDKSREGANRTQAPSSKGYGDRQTSHFQDRSGSDQCHP